jgi:hypothetical protein
MLDIYEYQKEYWNEKRKEYYADHKEELQAEMRQYRKNNAQTVKATEQRYREAHREERLEYNRRYVITEEKKEQYNAARRLKYKLNKEKK